MKNLKIILFFVTIGLILAVAVCADTSYKYPTYSPEFAELENIPESLKIAGFTNPQKVSVVQNSGYYPTYYYTVNETLNSAEAQAWGKAANMVSIFLREIPADWIYNNGEIKTEYLNGRYQVKASNMLLYAVITGPDKDKAEALLRSLIYPPSETLLQ